jgi:predicted TIM-barrel fold metal-dependent hydrolase
VTCEADEADLARPIAEIGEDRILMASDYPHFDSEYPHTVSTIRARKDLTERQKDKILGGTAARLLQL